MKVSDKSKVFYLIILLFFSIGAGIFWFDYINLIDVNQYIQKISGKEPDSVLYASDDEPSLIQLQEFEKQKQLLQERTAELDRRQALLEEQEKSLETELEKIDEIKKGLELEKKKLEDEKNKYSEYQENVKDLANKIQNMPPEQAVQIMIQWDDPLIIDVLRQMDRNAEEAGTSSITSYLISLMPKEKAGRIMYLMTQI